MGVGVKKSFIDFCFLEGLAMLSISTVLSIPTVSILVLRFFSEGKVGSGSSHSESSLGGRGRSSVKEVSLEMVLSLSES